MKTKQNDHTQAADETSKPDKTNKADDTDKTEETEEVDKKKVRRNFALDYIVRYAEKRLGCNRDDFIEWLTDSGKSEKTMRRYIKGNTPMKCWTFQQFWELVTDTVQTYLEYDNYGRSINPDAATIWASEKDLVKQICNLFFIDLEDPDRISDLPDDLRQYIEDGTAKHKGYLDTIKPIFEALDPAIAYSLQRNFPALASVTQDDIEFWDYILDMTADEKAAEKEVMLKEVRVNTETILEYLQSEEVRCWVDLKNTDYKDTARHAKGNWERFREKFVALPLPQYLLTMSFLWTSLRPASTGADHTEEEKVEIKLPGKEDVELLFIFKYCLPQNERTQFLTNK